MTGELDGVRALVTGGSRGIGRAIAEALAGEGASVVIGHYRDAETAERVMAGLQAASGTAYALEGDVSDEAYATALVRQTVEAFGGLDVVVNNAGILREVALLETSVTDFDRVVAVNLRGTFLVGREAIRQMVTQENGGRVINIASDLGYLGRARNTAYCASKGGVAAMTRSWAREFAPHILVNAIAPGPVDTDMLGADSMSAEQRAQESDIPLQRIGQPAEIAGVAAFLAGPRATFVTGQTYGVNGGSVMP